MTSILSKLTPKNLSSRLMLVLTVVISIAQLINLTLLVDANRLQARSNIVASALASLVQHVERLNEGRRLESWPGRRPQSNHFFITEKFSDTLFDSKFVTTNFDKLIDSTLSENGIARQSHTLLIGDREQLDIEGLLFLLEPGFSGVARNPCVEQSRSKSHAERGQRGQRPPPKSDEEKLPELLLLAVEMCSGVWAVKIVPHRSIEALTPKILLGTLTLLGLTLLTVWFFMRQVSLPLSKLTLASKKLGRGEQPSELDEVGPADIKEAARAFNQMQRRLNRTVETQRTMLRAVGHDLRTPLTSLRIRSEMIPKELNRDKFISTIDEMSGMTEEILSWAKNISGLEETASVDIDALLNSVVDDFKDQGLDVTVKEITNITLRTRRLAIKRALQNVISNAITYAGTAYVSAQLDTEYLRIHIDDDGTGIPEEKLDTVLQPFARLESSRNRETGGAGLGLSITATILHIEGGKLELSNRTEGGLRVTLSLPR